MSFLKFSVILYGLFWFIERFWPLLLVLVIYWVARKRWEEFKKKLEK
jgi:hypothetical protein